MKARNVFVAEQIKEEMMISTDQGAIDLEMKFVSGKRRDGVHHSEFHHFLDELLVASSDGIANRSFRVFRNDREGQCGEILR